MPRAAPEPFHRDLRLARFIPQFAVGPRLHRLMRGTPKGVSSTADVEVSTIHLPGPAGPVRCRLFRPVGGDARPALFWIHGGGFVLGSPEQDDATLLLLARRLGITVIASSYRLSPENAAPAALDDLTAVFRHTRAHGDDLGIDPSRIAIGGASAGGGLAAQLVNRLHDEGDPAPVFQLLLYPMLDDRTVLRTDIDTRHVRGWMPASNRFGWQSYLGMAPGDAAVPAAFAPARRQDLSGLPPTWIGVGTLDLFHDEDLEYVRRLQDAGVPVSLTVIPGAFHGFDALFRNAGVTRDLHEEWVRVLAGPLGVAPRDV